MRFLDWKMGVIDSVQNMDYWSLYLQNDVVPNEHRRSILAKDNNAGLLEKACALPPNATGVNHSYMYT